MSERFFESPTEINISDTTPLIFLEGPVQGAPDWQTPLAKKLLAARGDIAVASPRPTPDHELAFTSKDEATKERTSDKQVAWEYLARSLAMDLGGIVMWWAPQDASIPYKQGRVYGKTSNIETGEVWGWKRANPDFPFTLGYDPAFEASGANSKNYIERNQALMGYPVFGSLDDIARSILKQVPTGATRRALPSASQSVQRALDQLR